MSGWDDAQVWEERWWRDQNGYTNTWHEEWKQTEIYAERMGLVVQAWGRIDLGDTSVLDIGGGPVSLLLKCRGTGRRTVLDPLADQWPRWVLERYEAAGITVVCGRGEDCTLDGFDEVWIYNVLQHVDDPASVIQRAKSAGDRLRIFEWLNTGISDGHLHDLTRADLERWIGQDGVVGLVDYGQQQGWCCEAFHGVFDLEVKPALVGPWESSVERNRPLRFHIPAVPHTVTDKDRYTSCAFSEKVRKMCTILTRLGHEVFHYGCEGAKTEGNIVTIISDRFRLETYPDQEDRTKQYQFNENDGYHQSYYRNAIRAIKDRQQPGDFLLCPWGTGHKPIADGLAGGPSLFVVESGIGYPFTFAPFRVFETYWWMAHVYGQTQFNGDGSWYDAVIPNQFDPEDFDYSEDREDWFLYLGRIVKRKGVEVAVRATKEAGAKLVIAGQGSLVNENEGLDLRADHVEFAGYADVEKRRDLMRRARAIFMPTYFLEPFGGVMIEAFMSGCPVISTDWGSFVENNLHGVTGYRCRTMEQFTWATENIGSIRPIDCRNWAMENFTLDAVAPMYEEYFRTLVEQHPLGGRGDWYSPNPGRTNLNWLHRTHPRARPTEH